jgi:hypothetical protein
MNFTQIRSTLVLLSIAFLVPLAAACDTAPSPPEPSVQTDERIENLREEVAEVLAEAERRLDAGSAVILSNDSGPESESDGSR